MVVMNGKYDGKMKCTMVHQEGTILHSDAPKDVGGEATAFSPTDLMGAALGTCMLTTMGMFAERHGVDLSGATVSVTKDMVSDPDRRVGSLSARVVLPGSKIPTDLRPALQRVGENCPVYKSIHPGIKTPLEFVYE